MGRSAVAGLARPPLRWLRGFLAVLLPQLSRPRDEASPHVLREITSTSRGNQLTVDEERRKLALVASTAGPIWG
ncbi:MAG TPA: hypothetical protein VMH35_07425 [Streptosporangiaceae bacterium]|nr:hypothetical protein [Streptosporangiaceae bacterium]